MRVFAVILIALLLHASPVAAVTLYKWVDDQGTTHFTREPPVDREYEEISAAAGNVGKRTPPPPSMNVDPPDEEKPATLPQDRAEEDKADAQNMAAQCERARENIYWLTESERVQVNDEDTGETRWVSGDERIRLRDEVRAFIEQNCQGEDG